MDAKDLRIESALGAHTNDGSTKYGQGGTSLQTNGNKTYHDIGSISSTKVDLPTARPCAIIGPDRVLPPHSTSDGYLKKVAVEPWPCTENVYMHPPEYPLKPSDYPPQRNISPRQTFQENMQRIMVPPTYVSVKNDDKNLKNSKSMPSEAKYCDVPYTISPINNEPKIIKNPEGLGPNNNPAYTQPMPQSWSGNGVSVRPLRPYGAPDLYQYSDYPNCPAPRAISMIRPHRNVHEDVPQTYQDRFYHEANLRFKPYSTPKERPHQHPQARYDYIANYPNTFHPQALYPPHKYDLQKSMPPHPYPVYPPVPLKYLDRRMPANPMERYQRSPSQQINLNPPFCNQNIPPNYGPVPGNCMQNRAFPYSADPSTKPMIQNRLYFDNSARKYYPSSENMFINDINRPQTMKNDVLYPSFPPFNIHSLPPHHMYRKDSPMKGFEHGTHFRNIEHSVSMNSLSRLPLQFSPQTISISPDSNTSNDTIQTLSNAQEDCGYVSQSSTASVRSMESGINRISSDLYRRNDLRYESFSHTHKSGQKLDVNTSSKDKKDLNVRQFLQMWNEGDDEGNDNNKETSLQKDSSNSLAQYEAGNNQEQLYVLGLVNVPSEELGKYDHIEKISKLPENIKGYNSIELLNQYEKLVESPNINQFNLTPPQPKQKDLPITLPLRNTIPRQGMEVHPRPLSPLDVEAKISQSVIHKEVGCNFEIRPCSPQIMSVDVAAPVHNVLSERLIEKVVNPIVMKSPMQHKIEETHNEISRNSPKVTSCKMVNNQFPSPNINDPLKTNYCLHDMESNSGICLASLPRLDNDIELNFPEINQQFINANKIETIQASSMRDLPILDTENGGNIHKNRNNLPTKPLIPEYINSGSESEKEGSKLSKYRKHKRNSSIANESSLNSNLPLSLHRTDSVIIKNPENAKSQVERLNNTPSVNNKPDNDTIINPTNLVAEDERAIDYSDRNVNGILKEKCNKDYIPTEIYETAIDFSLNKSDDEHSSCINSINNLNGSLQNNIDINKTIFLENESNKHTHEIGNINSPKQLEENSVSDQFPIIQSNSPPLGEFTCNDMLDSSTIPDKEYSYRQFNSDLLNNKTDLDSIVEENLILHDQKEIVTDTLSVSALPPEEIIPEKDSPISNLQNEKVSENLNSSNDISLSNSDITKDIESEVLNNCLQEDAKDLTNPLTKAKHDLVEAGAIEQNVNSVIIENNSNLFEEGNNTVTSLSLSVLNVEIGNSSESLDDITQIDSTNEKDIQECQIEPHKETESFDVNKAEKETEVLNKEEEILRSEEDKEHKECELSVDVVNGGSDKYDMSADLTSPSEEDVTDNKNKRVTDNIFNEDEEFCRAPDNVSNENDVKLTSITSLDIKNASTEIITNLENNVSADIIHNDKDKEMIETEMKLDTNISNTLNDKESSIESLEQTVISCNAENKSFFKKELFSPWLQNLLVHNEGPCASFASFEKEDILKVNSCLNKDEQNFNNVVVTPSLIENKLELGPKNIRNDIVCNNFDEISNYINTDSAELVSNEIGTEENKGSDRLVNNIDIDARNINHTEIILDDSKVVVENNVAESLPEITTDATDEIDSAVENNININVKLCEYVKEKPFLSDQLASNRFPSRRSRTLKRSLSESAVEYTASDYTKENNVNDFIYTNKRTKLDNSEILVESQVTAEDLTSFIQNNRRNSISAIYNDENVSFCILIDNDCVLTDENEDCQKICYTEIQGDCLSTICTEAEAENTDLNELISYEENGQCEYDNELILQNVEDETIEETWVEDVACMETVFNDDIAEDIEINAPSSPKYSDTSEDESDKDYLYNVNENEHTNKVKYIYGNQMCDDDAQLVEKLYRTPQMDVNKTLIDRESQIADEFNRYYDNDSLEKILSESNSLDTPSVQNDNSIISDVADNSLVLPSSVTNDDAHGNKENLKATFSEEGPTYETNATVNLVETKNVSQRKSNEYDDTLINSCESSSDVSYRKDEEGLHYAISSSPEVSSTTSEEKGSGILLKIRSYKGTKISEINEMGSSFNRTHSQSYHSSNYGLPTSRPLITKAAQKYIPPLKETIRDLKVKLHLPKQSLYKLQQLKKSKEQPKIKTSHTKHYTKNVPQEIPKKTKPKPKFEDVLKSIDEIQFKMHKEKNRKSKQSIPKVIIKKNQNGAHYASTQSKETFNPDLTGRKWQPWVFLEKSNFIDKMALKQKFKAIYNHRKKTYVLAESFRKYKSINNYKSITNSKFVISHPKSSNNTSTGKLKYTFRLKHN
ncbi:uncharacterized protein [Epargyreus clarus]|uniref:uncharacterized protein n=1 Tax=Epargyreus clarus TaxID=520877 RepID=UPI003C2FD0C8